MLIGKRVEIDPGDTVILVDEADFDGPFSVLIRGGDVNIGDSTVTFQEGGFRHGGDLFLEGVADSIYAAHVFDTGTGSPTTVNVLAYSVQEG